ncbi:hypothetical protein GLAREA_12649 [Glarea lozoyensis ATCC 20868]|uniref:Uncharacterized protein n=1 Tax=Glarea lozoyensis (strain ATCC 20868 / MF5171) TaxID=1116229 RepID=S3DH56_GLAL2|nr:uncharacterized protein GLAREA_12649 [Glarea lozoyensis ATCC 20868]EPE31346.1 hypothetical protein GLAREA_12649 [Glarea lozoyensis ATCC 20868]
MSFLPRTASGVHAGQTDSWRFCLFCTSLVAGLRLAAEAASRAEVARSEVQMYVAVANAKRECGGGGGASV